MILRLKEFWQRLCLALSILKDKDGGLENHFKFELAKQLALPKTDLDRIMAQNLLSLARTFSLAGHSGFSASFALDQLDKLLRYKPISPLTGKEDEWVEVGEKLFQNKRCSTVFKTQNEVYDIDGAIFVEPDGLRFTSIHSRVPVQFPYIQKSVMVEVPKDSSIEQRLTAKERTLAALRKTVKYR